jgi:predicted TIM-barrel fold metal-dependent hydrolase
MSKVSRRHFMEGSIMAPLQAVSAQQARGPVTAGAPGIIDTNVYLSRWPSRRVYGDEPAELVELLQKHGVIQAWTGSFDTLLHKNTGAMNTRLAEQCSRYGGGILLPFGSINPKLPDWEEDLRRCHEQFRMLGIRVHPTYHHYTLMDPVFLQLLQVAAERALLVQIAAWMEDERCPNPLLRVPVLDLDVLPGLLGRVPNVRLEILNAFVHVNLSNQLPQRVSQFHVGFDFAALDGMMELTNLTAAAGAGKVVFGSYSPLFYFESALLKVREAALSEDQNRALFSENARRLLGAPDASKS